MVKIHKHHLSLRGLRTFCLAGRHLSFRVASQALFVTASAVSHQIKTLEQELGVSLFDRGAKSLELTPAGQALLADIDPLIQQLDNATSRYRHQSSRQSLRISVQPFFANELFVPELAAFTAQHPHIDINLDTTNEDSQTHPAAADVSIRIFTAAPKGLASDAFFPLRMVPACTPRLHAQITAQDGGALAPFPMLVHSARLSDWERWSTSAKVDLPEPKHTIQLDSMVAVVEAVRQGLGVGLVPVPVSARRFEAGQMQALFPHEAQMPDRYYFVSNKQKARTRPVQALRSWVLKTFTPMA